MEHSSSSEPGINSQDSLMMCAPAAAGAVSDAACVPVLLLQADAASRWRALLPSGEVPGMQPEMVLIADLLCCTGEYLTTELNGFLKGWRTCRICSAQPPGSAALTAGTLSRERLRHCKQLAAGSLPSSACYRQRVLYSPSSACRPISPRWSPSGSLQ